MKISGSAVMPARWRRPGAGNGIDYARLGQEVAAAMTGLRVEVGAGDISRVALDNMSRVARRRGYRSGG